MIRYFSNLAKKTVKTGVVIGGLITVYQAAQKTQKKSGGEFKWDMFVDNFKGQASNNIKLVADVAKGLIGKYYDSYRVSDKGENGYVEKNPEPENDKVNEIVETIRGVAPDVIDKVQEFVDDVRENAPEYKAKAQEFVEDVKDAAIKALELDDAENEPEEPKEEKKIGTTVKTEKEAKTRKAAKPVKEAKAEKAAKPVKEAKAEKAEKSRKPRKTAKADKDEKDEK